MPVLQNAKHELFAQEVAKGATATDAHEKAGYKRNDGNASTLAARPDVQARVKELKGAAAERATVSAAQVLEELAKLAFANPLDYVRIGPDGQPYIDFSNLTRDQAAALSQIVVESRVEAYETPIDEEEERQPQGGALKRRRSKQEPAGITDAAGIGAFPQILKVRYRNYDKLRALELLGRNLGMWKDKVEHDVADPLKELMAQISGTAFRPTDGSK